MIHRTPLLLSLLPAAVLAAQEPGPEAPAERAFRDAWWAESGRGDLPAALAGYLAAAAAEGPAAIRARALLAAGAVQQRLGKSESAIATFRQVLRDFPAEAAVAEQARVHLRELTAVDLREGYDEWHERWLFGEEVQRQVLARIDELAAVLAQEAARRRDSKERRALQQEIDTARARVLAFGRGSAPALHQFATAPQRSLAEAAVDLLFELGELPAARALLGTSGWTSSSENWRRVLAGSRAGGSEPGALRECPRADPAHARLVAAALRGPAALADVVLDQEPPLARGGSELASAARALVELGGDGRARVLAALGTPEVPLRTREAIEQGLAARPPDLGVAEWLAISREPLHFRLRIAATERCARRLRLADGEALDELLRRVEEAPAGEAKAELLEALNNGLAQNDTPLQVPWSVSRLRRLLVLLARRGSIANVYTALVRDEVLRSVLVEAALGEPGQIAAAFADDGGEIGDLAQHFELQLSDEYDIARVEGLWNRSLAQYLERAWDGWNDVQRLDALRILPEAILLHGARDDLRQFVGRRIAAAPERLRGPLEALHERLQEEH